MKRLLIVVWCLPLGAGHVDLSKATKLEFVQKRLDMMKSQLVQKLRKALTVEKGSAQAAQVKEHIAQLKLSIPITQNSLKALQRT